MVNEALAATRESPITFGGAPILLTPQTSFKVAAGGMKEWRGET
jgi:hypothetical protein